MSSEPLERLSVYKVTPTQADKLENYGLFTFRSA